MLTGRIAIHAWLSFLEIQNKKDDQDYLKDTKFYFIFFNFPSELKLCIILRTYKGEVNASVFTYICSGSGW